MMISSNRLLDYVFTKASEGDVRAKITYEYLRPLFEQGEKKEAIDRKLEYIERCERIRKAIVGGASYSKEDEKMKRNCERGIVRAKEQLKEMQAEYDAEYGA